jgi:signal transduction histidine kinase
MEPRALAGAVGYLVGAVLHAMILRLLLRRPDRRPRERLLATLAAALLAWNATRFIGAFAALLLGERASALEALLDAFGVPALALVPSLILHTLAVIRGRDAPISRAWMLVYAPFPAIVALFLAEPIAAPRPIEAIVEGARRETARWVGPFADPGPTALGLWLATALVGGGLLFFDLARRAPLRADALPATARLDRLLGKTLLAAAALVAAAVIAIGRRRPGDGVAVELLVVAGSTLPSAALAYAVSRVYRIRLVLRRGLTEVAIAITGAALSLLVISLASRLVGERLGWNVRVVEAVGFTGLLLAFFPFRRRVLDAFAHVFDPLRAKEAAVLKSLAQDLARPGASHPSELAARVATGIAGALALERAGLAIRAGEGAREVPAAPPGWVDYAALLSALETAPPGLLVPDDPAIPEALGRALAAARVERVRALRYEGDLVGALVLGRRADSTAIDAEELLAVESIAGALAAACVSVRLVDDKLRLERRLAEEARLAVLGRFSATVAHRVKNPLASIKAIAQTLRADMPDGDPRREDLAVVVGEVDALAKVVGQLLGFARGAPAGATGPVDVRAVAGDVLLLCTHEARAKGVALVLAPREDGAPPEPPARAEPSALREVIANLVENAIVFSPEGGEVRLAVEAAPGAVRLSVRDAGPGVSEEDRARIFEPFFTTRPGGTGLGLAISRQRVEAWGGRLILSESITQGAEFICEIPLAGADEVW